MKGYYLSYKSESENNSWRSTWKCRNIAEELSNNVSPQLKHLLKIFKADEVLNHWNHRYSQCSWLWWSVFLASDGNSMLIFLFELGNKVCDDSRSWGIVFCDGWMSTPLKVKSLNFGPVLATAQEPQKRLLGVQSSWLLTLFQPVRMRHLKPFGAGWLQDIASLLQFP